MPTKRAFPYNYAEHQLRLVVQHIDLDGENRSDYINSDKLIIDLQKLDWENADIHVNIELPADEVEKLIPEEERESPNWHAMIAASCRETRWRRGFKIFPKNGERFAWSGILKVSREELHGALRLTAFLVRSLSLAQPKRPYGGRRNVRLASSREWTLQVDKAQTPPGGYLETKWVNFREADNPKLKKNKSLVYYLDMDGDMPVLYLNSGIPELDVILESAATTGLPAAIRDALFSSIAQSVWMSLAMSSILAGYNEEGERLDLDDWRENVLMRFEKKLKHVVDLAAAVNDRESVPVLMEALSASIQEDVKIPHTTEKILKEADRQ